MQITYFSDVHLEFGRCSFPEHNGDIVVAAGDIAPGSNALPWLLQSENVPVVYVAGNHEFYGEDSGKTINLLRAKSEGSEIIHFLEKDCFEYRGVRFLGTTLWADFDNGNPEVMRLLEQQMSDFSYIRCGERKLRARDVMHTHFSSLHWLIEQLETKYHGPTVVVTHHAPSMKSWHLEAEDKRRHGYCSELDFMAARYDIDLWIHGHTHTRHEYKMGNDTTVACNARGYYGLEKANVDIDITSIQL